MRGDTDKDTERLGDLPVVTPVLSSSAGPGHSAATWGGPPSVPTFLSTRLCCLATLRSGEVAIEGGCLDYTVVQSPRIVCHSSPVFPYQLLPGGSGKVGDPNHCSAPVIHPRAAGTFKSGQPLSLSRDAQSYAAAHGHLFPRSLRCPAMSLPRGHWPLLTYSRVKGLPNCLGSPFHLEYLICPKNLLTLGPKHSLPPTHWSTQNKLTPFRCPRDTSTPPLSSCGSYGPT